MSEYVTVKDLPQVVQSALESVGYGRKDIAVDVKTTVSLSGAGGSGRQSFAVLIDLDRGRFHTETGSWGGANMFNRTNAVDNDDRTYPLPGNGAAIVGSRGGGQPVWAHIYIPQSMTSKILAPPAPAVTDTERKALSAYAHLKSGPGRQESLCKDGVTDAILDDLVKRGYLKRARNGATQITTLGKNAAGRY